MSFLFGLIGPYTLCHKEEAATSEENKYLCDNCIEIITLTMKKNVKLSHVMNILKLPKDV